MRRSLTIFAIGAYVCASILLGGCAAPDASPGAPAPPSSYPAAGNGAPLALVNGVPVYATELHPTLAEYAGAAALADLILDRALAAELRSRGVSISPDDLERERSLLASGVASASDADGSQIAELLTGLRRARGLGPQNFPASLHRSAALRALAAGRQISDADHDAAFALEFGPRVRARVIVVPDRRRAVALADELRRAVGAGLIWEFASRAAAESRGSTAGAGGLLPDASPADPAWPPGLRTALESQVPGEVGPVIAVDGAYAILLVESRTPARTPGADELAAFEARLRARMDRLAMEELASSLLARANVTVLDPSLGWAWGARRP
ncbi:MAG: peptidylprolyl isomerase [Planctomycetota bacterium]|nr:peptidylprolyl isomerase [Planctomycetota bacterium]